MARSRDEAASRRIPRPRIKRGAAATPPSSDGPFAAAAAALHAAGLTPIPSGGEDGKQPLVPHARFRAGMATATLCGFLNRFASANVGVLTGTSPFGITVIDVDHPDAVDIARGLFGETPLEVRTPRGGTHLWYRASGERSTNLRNVGLPVDVRGHGGFVVVPPSRRPAAPSSAAGSVLSTEGEYSFIGQGLAVLPDLPQISERGREWLERLPSIMAGETAEVPSPPLQSHPTVRAQRTGGAADETTAVTTELAPPPSGATADGRSKPTVPEGCRNHALFRQALRTARDAPDLETLLAHLRRWNAQHCCPPLDLSEVEKVARSAWDYRCKGRIWVGTAGVSQLSTEEMNLLQTSDGLALLLRLRQAHGSRGEPFAICVRAMGKVRSVLDLGESRLRKARDELLRTRFLVQVSEGGHGPRDPALYWWGQRPE